MKKNLIVYAIVLIVVYCIAWLVKPLVDFSVLVGIIMYAPCISALMATKVTRTSVQWGKVDWWIFVAFLCVVIPLAALLGAAAFGVLTFSSTNLASVLIRAPLTVAVSCITAFGEEVGWRGFLWPLLRTQYRFVYAAAALGVIWFFYHVPVIFSGDYGSLSGLPAFLVALVGFTLFVGVVTDRARAVWPSVIAHGAWNALVAPNFSNGLEKISFAGDQSLLGEFGWIPAGAMLALGAGFAVWHELSGRGDVYERT